MIYISIPDRIKLKFGIDQFKINHPKDFIRLFNEFRAAKVNIKNRFDNRLFKFCMLLIAVIVVPFESKMVKNSRRDLSLKIPCNSMFSRFRTKKLQNRNLRIL